MWFVTTHAHLTRPEEVKADVWVTCGGIHAVMAKVLTDVFWCRLRQKSIYALPRTHSDRFKCLSQYKKCKICLKF